MTRALLLLTVGLALVSCGPPRTSGVKPQLVPPPDQVDFGTVPVLNPRLLEIPVQNVGRADLEVTEVSLKEPVGIFAIKASPTLIQAGQTLSVVVVFVLRWRARLLRQQRYATPHSLRCRAGHAHRLHHRRLPENLFRHRRFCAAVCRHGT